MKNWSNQIKVSLFQNWTLWRASKLVLSLFFIVYGITMYDHVLTIGGIFLLVHTALNFCGVCAATGCEINQNKK